MLSTTAVDPAADATLRPGQTPLSDAPTLEAGMAAASPVSAVMKFNLAGIDPHVDLASVTLTMTAASKAGYANRAYLVAAGEDPWDATTGWPDPTAALDVPVATTGGMASWAYTGSGVDETIALDVSAALQRTIRRGDLNFDGRRAADLATEEARREAAAADLAALELAIDAPEAFLEQFASLAIDATDLLDRGDWNDDGQIDAADLPGFLAWHGIDVGDANLDGQVDQQDLVIWQSHYGLAHEPNYTQGDFNLDGRIDGRDRLIFERGLGQTAATAPPLSELALVIVAAEGHGEGSIVYVSREHADETIRPQLVVEQTPEVVPGRFELDANGQFVATYHVIGGTVHDVVATLSRSDLIAEPLLTVSSRLAESSAAQLPGYGRSLAFAAGDATFGDSLAGLDGEQLVLTFSYATTPGGPQIVAESQTLANGALLTDLGVVDATGDGRPDRLLYDSVARELYLWRQLADRGWLESWGQLDDAGIYSRFEVGDFNGDGRGDLLARRGDLTWRLALSDSTQFVVRPLNLTAAIETRRVGDYDGDGADELLGWADDAWQVLDYDEATTATTKTNWHTDVGPTHFKLVEGERQIFAGDVNRDGQTDLYGLTPSGTWTVFTAQMSEGKGRLIAEDWGDWFDVDQGITPDARYRAALEEFAWVANEVRLQFYAGLMKGIEATQQTRAGNPFDQAALLVDRLDAVGVDAQIVVGDVTAPIEDVQRWVGAKTEAAATVLLRQAFDAGAVVIDDQIQFRHAWVEARLPSAEGLTPVYLDPSWKFQLRQPGIDVDLTDATTSEIADRTTRGTFDEFQYLVDADVHELPVEWYERQLQEHLALSIGGVSVAEVPYDGPVVRRHWRQFPATPIDAELPRSAPDGPAVLSVLHRWDDLESLKRPENDAARRQYVHRFDVQLEREIRSDSRVTYLAGTFETNQRPPHARDVAISLFPIGWGPWRGTATRVPGDPGADVLQVFGAAATALRLPENYEITARTRLRMDVEAHGDPTAGLLVGLDSNDVYSHGDQEWLATLDGATTPGGPATTLTIPIGADYLRSTNLPASHLILGQHFPVSVSTPTYVNLSNISLYEAVPGSRSDLIPADNAVRLRGATAAQLVVDVDDEPGQQSYPLTPHSVLQLEFTAEQAGVLHAIRWDADLDDHNNAAGASGRYQVAGSEDRPGYTPVAPPYPGAGTTTISIPLGEAVAPGTTVDLARLIFESESGVDPLAESLYADLRIVEDHGVGGIAWQQQFDVPDASRASIYLDFLEDTQAAETPWDDLQLPRLWVDGEIVQQSDAALALQHGDVAWLTITHYQPEEVSRHDEPISHQYELTPGELAWVGLDANQIDVARLVDRRAQLIDAVVDGADPEEIPVLLAYANAKYWFDHNRMNALIDGMLHVVGVQQWVGSGLVKATRQLYALDPEDHQHLQYPMLPVGFAVDLPNWNHAAVDLTTGRLDTEAIQLVGWNSSSLENAILEEIANAESISTIRGLKNAFENAPGRSVQEKVDGLMVFERVDLGGTPLVYWRGNLGRDLDLPADVVDSEGHLVDGQMQTRDGVRAYGSEKQLGGGPITATVFEQLLASHRQDDGANPLADRLWNRLMSAASARATVVVPYLESSVGVWQGGVGIAEVASPSGWTGLYAIQEKNGPATAGGALGGLELVRPKPPALQTGAFDWQIHAGDPVNTANGNMFFDETDVEFPNRGVPLTFARHYDAQSIDDIGMGVGWTYTFGDLLYRETVDQSDYVVWLTAGGERRRFRDEGASGYVTPSQLQGEFAYEVEQGQASYIYRDRAGMEYRFEEIALDVGRLNVVGRLVSQTDLHQHGVAIEYVAPNSRQIAQIRDASPLPADEASRLTVVYHPSPALAGHIHMVQKYDASQTSNLGVWVYDYAYLGHEHTEEPTYGLSQVYRPAQTAALRVADPSHQDEPLWPTTRYAYYGQGGGVETLPDNGLLKQIERGYAAGGGSTFVETGPWQRFEYYPNRRTFRVTQGAADESLAEGDVQSFSYNLFRNLTEFTNERGALETYIHLDNGLVATQIHADRSRVSYQWGLPDSPGEYLLARTVDEVGAVESFRYYAPGQDGEPYFADPDRHEVPVGTASFRLGELQQALASHHIDSDGNPIGLVEATQYFHTMPPVDRPHLRLHEQITRIAGDAAIIADADLSNDHLAEQRITTQRHDEQGRLVEIMDAAGHRTTYSYYDSDHPVVHERGMVRSQTRAQGQTGDERASWRVLDDAFEVTGAELVVRLSGEQLNPDAWLLADAIRLERIVPATGQVEAVEVLDDGPASDGRFRSSRPLLHLPDADGYRGDVSWLRLDESGQVEWRFLDLSAGFYRVAAAWTPHDDALGIHAQYELIDVDGETSTVIAIDPADEYVDFAAHTTHFRYDRAGNVIATTAAGVPSGLVEYHHTGSPSVAIDGTGVATHTTYNALGWLTARGPGDGEMVFAERADTFFYDATGRLRAAVDPLGHEVEYEYDRHGNVVREQAADDAVTTQKFDAIGNLQSTTDPLLRTTRYVYDSRDRLVQTIYADGTSSHLRYNGVGQVVATVDPLDHVTTLQYDAGGRLVEKTRRLATFDGQGETLVREVQQFNAFGELVESVDPNGVATVYRLDHRGQRVETRTLAAGLRLDDDNYDPAEPLHTASLETFDYDAHGNLDRHVIYDVAHPGLTVLPADPRDLIAQSPPEDPWVQVTAFQYNAADELVETTYADASVARTLYDVAGRLLRSVDALGRATHWAYDAFGQHAATIAPDPDGPAGPLEAPITQYAYDETGNRVGMIDPLGRETRWIVDQQYRTVAAVDPLGGITQTIFDSAGQSVAVIDPRGAAEYRRYDQRGRLVQRRAADPDGSGPQRAPTHGYRYDAAGNKIAVIDPFGHVTSSRYDSLDRLRSRWALQEVTIDDGDPEVEVTAGGTNATDIASGHLGDGKLVTNLTNDPEAVWHFASLPAGVYRVFATWDALSTATEQLTAELHAGGQTYPAVLLNQTEAPGEDDAAVQRIGRDWVVLFEQIRLGGDEADRLVFRAAAGESFVVDAVRLERVIDVRYEYDLKDNLVHEETIVGAAYDDRGNPVPGTSLGATNWGYDARDRQTSITFPAPGTADADGVPLPRPLTTLEYDGYGNLVAEVDHRGGGTATRRTEYFYDLRNRLIDEVADAGGDQQRRYHWQFDRVGNVVVEIAAMGTSDQRIARTIYDRLDRPIAQYDNAPTADLEADLDAAVRDDINVRLVRTHYDAAGNVARLQHDMHLADDVRQLETRLAVDSLDRVVQRTESGRYGDGLQSRTHRYEYDAAGNQVAEIDPLGNVRRWQYDRLGRMIAAVDPIADLTQPTTPAQRTFSYDAVGRQVERVSGLGDRERFVYDAFGSLVRSYDGRNAETLQRYDPAGNLALLIDPTGNQTTREYDRLDRLVRETIYDDSGDPLPARTMFYDATGMLDVATDRNGRLIDYEYDRLDRLIGEVWFADAAAESPVGEVRRKYDDLDRLVESVYTSAGEDAYQAVTAYAYDGLDRLTGWANHSADGLRTTSDMPLAQRTTVSTVNPNESSFQSVRTQWLGGVPVAETTEQFDALGQLRRVDDRYGLTLDGMDQVETQTDLVYTQDGRLRQTRRGWHEGEASPSLPLTATFHYDDAGRIDHLMHRVGGALLVGQEFGYNQNNQITLEETVAGADYSEHFPAAGRRLLDYDARGQLLAAGESFYEYDPSGNRNEAGQIAGANNRLLADDQFDYQYDAEGNLKLRTHRATGVTRHFTWDHRNRLIAVSDVEADGVAIQSEVTYRYDAGDRLIARRSTSEPDQYYIDDGVRRLQLDEAGRPVARYQHGVLGESWYEQALDLEGGTQTSLRLPATDHQNSVAAVLDGAMELLQSIDYEPFGDIREIRQRDESGQIVSLDEPRLSDLDAAFAFHGRAVDGQTELSHHRARWYDGRSGRFVSEDPIQADLNAYRFAGNDPINLADPTGLAPTFHPVQRFNSGVSAASVSTTPSAWSSLAGNAARTALQSFVIDPAINHLQYGIAAIDAFAATPLPTPSGFGPRVQLTPDNLAELTNQGRVTEVERGVDRVYNVRFTTPEGLDQKEVFEEVWHLMPRGRGTYRTYESRGVTPLHVDNRLAAEAFVFDRQTSQRFAKQLTAVDLTLSAAPGTGDARDLIELQTGRDAITQAPLSTRDRLLTGAAVALPIVAGAFLRRLAGSGEDAATELVEGDLYDVGLAKDLRKHPAPYTQVHHAPQSRKADTLLGDFNLKNHVGNEPAIRLSLGEHVAVSQAQSLSPVAASARELLAQEIRILRNVTEAPNEALRELIELNKRLHQSDFLPLHRADP